MFEPEPASRAASAAQCFRTARRPLPFGANEGAEAGLLGPSYSKAPRFSAVFPLVEKLIKLANANVADFNDNLIERITAELGGRPKFIRSSELDKQSRLAGQERVVHICQRLGATHYVNPIGGTRLYDADRFARAGIGLSFLEPAEITYPQFGDPPVPNLSIIDVLMFNDAERVARMLKQYQLKPGIQGRQ